MKKTKRFKMGELTIYDKGTYKNRKRIIEALIWRARYYWSTVRLASGIDNGYIVPARVKEKALRISEIHSILDELGVEVFENGQCSLCSMVNELLAIENENPTKKEEQK